MKKMFLELAISSIHQIAPVATEPCTAMTRWRLMETTSLDGERSRHLVGQANGEGRVSTDIVKLDVPALRATTKSGRIYELQGPSGYDFDADYVFAFWMRVNSIDRSRDITPALLRLHRRVHEQLRSSSAGEQTGGQSKP